MTSAIPQFEFDLEDAARYPSQSQLVWNKEGTAPGWAIENVYIVPGLPAEMKVIFESIANEFDGDQRTRTVNSSKPESHLNELIETVRDRFDVTAGSYPGDGRKRITLQR